MGSRARAREKERTVEVNEEKLRSPRDGDAMTRSRRRKRPPRDDTSPGYNRFSFRIRSVLRKFDNVNRSRVLVPTRSHVVSRRFNRVKDIDPQVKAEHVHGHAKYSHCHGLFKFATLLYLVHQIAAVHVFHHEVQTVLQRKAESGYRKPPTASKCSLNLSSRETHICVRERERERASLRALRSL